MRNRLAMVLAILLVSGVVLRLQSAGRAQDQKRELPTGDALSEAQSLILAIDVVQETLNEQRTIVLETKERLKKQQARLQDLEERVKKLKERIVERARARKAKGEADPPRPKP